MAHVEMIETPDDVVEAAAILDRLARYCVFECEKHGECVDSDCDAGRLSRSAAEYLAAHWAAAEN